MEASRKPHKKNDNVREILLYELDGGIFGFLSERDDLENCCEGLTLENRCIAALAAEAKEDLEKTADREKANATAKTTRKGQVRLRAAVADKQAVALEAELMKEKNAHAQLADSAARYKANATKARSYLEYCRPSSGSVVQTSELTSATLDDAWKLSVKLSKAAVKTSRQLTGMPKRPQLFEDEVGFLKWQKD